MINATHPSSKNVLRTRCTIFASSRSGTGSRARIIKYVSKPAMPITAGANFKKIITSMKHGSEIAKSRVDLITTVWPEIILFFLAVVDGSEGVRGGASKAKIANGGSATIARWLSPACGRVEPFAVVAPDLQRQPMDSGKCPALPAAIHSG